MAEAEEISLVEEIARLGGNEPFLPFSIVMASGSRYDVEVNDGIVVGRSVMSFVKGRLGYHSLRQSQIGEVNIPGESHRA